MRGFGSVLILLGVTAFSAGIILGVMLFAEVRDIYIKMDGARIVAENKIGDVDEVFNDIDIIYERSKMVVHDYETGAIDNIHDDQIKALLKDINSVTAKSIKLKNEIDQELGNIDELKLIITHDYQPTLIKVIISLVCLISSGWLFGLGVFLRKK